MDPDSARSEFKNRAPSLATSHRLLTVVDVLARFVVLDRWCGHDVRRHRGNRDRCVHAITFFNGHVARAEPSGLLAQKTQAGL